MSKEPVIYVPEDNCVKIAGGTAPMRAALCGLHFYQKGNRPVEFLSIGASAGHQTTKALCIFKRLMLEEAKCAVAFIPIHVKVRVHSKETSSLLDGMVWQATIIQNKS